LYRRPDCASSHFPNGAILCGRAMSDVGRPCGKRWAPEPCPANGEQWDAYHPATVGCRDGHVVIIDTGGGGSVVPVMARPA